jgi:hypothetical protein
MRRSRPDASAGTPGCRVRAAAGAATVVGSLLLLSPAASAAHVPRAPVVARLHVDAVMQRVGRVVSADPRASRLPAGRVAIRLTFGDRSAPVVMHRPGVRRHRYRRAGRYTITLTIRAGGHTSRASRRVLIGHQVVQGTLAARVTALDGGDVGSVAGDPDGAQTVRLAAGAPAARPGQILLLPAGGRFPDGLLGRVSKVSGRDGRTVTVTPATLDDAYRDLRVDAGGTFATT